MSDDKLFKPPTAPKPSQKSVIKSPVAKTPPRNRQNIVSSSPVMDENMPSITRPRTPAFGRRKFTELKMISQDPDISGQVGQDPFVKSELVFGLNDLTFTPFLSNRDVAFVFFYDPTDSESHWCKPRVAKAAETTKRANHVYAAVNCMENPILCYRQSAQTLPTYIVYSKGTKVRKIRDTAEITSVNMKAYVESAPVSEGAKTRRPLGLLRVA
ncbi:unnamed protein product [Candidula unifasciata]|uniref:Thioredoxin domain-containing protein n=1 Tax=Candidula unifasciata TaxID=100452 RepID=A0A8S4A3W5_9EUPU|nr:unnamed protein product [Candidula unifasciata]